MQYKKRCTALTKAKDAKVNGKTFMKLSKRKDRLKMYTYMFMVFTQKTNSTLSNRTNADTNYPKQGRIKP